MALKRTAQQSYMDDLIKALDLTIPDEAELILSITGDGFRIGTKANMRQVSVRPAVREDRLAFEFGDLSDSWTNNVICVWLGEHVLANADSIARWFTIDDGFVFNVPVNGSLQAHSVSRIDGKHRRGIFKEAE